MRLRFQGSGQQGPTQRRVAMGEVSTLLHIRARTLHPLTSSDFVRLVAEWIHFTLLGIILPTIKPKVYTFGGL